MLDKRIIPNIISSFLSVSVLFDARSKLGVLSKRRRKKRWIKKKSRASTADRVGNMLLAVT